MGTEVTLQQTIGHFEYGISHDIFREPVLSYAKLAVQALRVQQEMEENTPLTVQDLLAKIDEPIFVRFLDDGFIAPAVLDAKTDGTVMAIWGCFPGDILLLEDYGKTWVAYRYRPKEDKDG